MQSGAHFLRWYLHAAHAWVVLPLLFDDLVVVVVVVVMMLLLLILLMVLFFYWGGLIEQKKKGVRVSVSVRYELRFRRGR